MCQSVELVACISDISGHLIMIFTFLDFRKHRKGIEEETAKKRTKKTQKFQRAVVGATLSDILAKRNQKPEVRKAQREQAIR